VILVGNLPEGLEEDCDKLPCFQLLPEEMQHKAFFDRLSGFVPGWRLTVIKGAERHLSTYYGFAADYLCEVLHALREQRDYQYVIDQNVRLQKVTIRDEKSVKKLASGLLKLLFPKVDESAFSPEEIGLCVEAVVGYRQRIIDQRYIVHRDPRDNRRIEYEFV
jgi:ATP-dependent Lon protease